MKGVIILMKIMNKLNVLSLSTNRMKSGVSDDVNFLMSANKEYCKIKLQGTLWKI